MGNVKSSMQPLALIAVARQLRLQRIQMVALRDALSSFADSTGFVDKSCFKVSLKQAKIVNPGDVEIFDLLFIMWDGLGTEKIPCKEFSTGVSVLACPHDDVVSILRFALHIQDELNTGLISPKCLHTVLRSIHATASYFGDAQLKEGDITAIVETVFDTSKSLLTHSVCANRLQANAYVKRFIKGKVQNRVQFKEELAMVTEFDRVSCLSEISDSAHEKCLTPTKNIKTHSDSMRCSLPEDSYDFDSWDSLLSDDDDDASHSTGSFSRRTSRKCTLSSPCNGGGSRPVGPPVMLVSQCNSRHRAPHHVGAE